MIKRRLELVPFTRSKLLKGSMADDEIDAEHYVVCGVCGENLGVHRPYFAQEHLRKYPDHKQYRVLSYEEKGVSTA